MALLDGRQLDERILAVLDCTGRTGEYWIGIRWCCWMDERRMGGRVLEWDTVSLLDGRPLDERMMDGRVLHWDTASL